MKENFDVLIGCRQGGQESPCIFNYFFDYVLKVAACEIDKHFPDGWGIEFNFDIPYFCSNKEQKKAGRLNGVEMIQWLLYADDIVLFCKNVAEAEKIMNILNNTCLRFGLTISFSKTKTQVFNNNELADLPFLFSVGENVIENVSEFTYLGQLFSNKDPGSYTELCISKAVGKFYEMKNVFKDHRINMGTRLLETCVRSRLTYGTQAMYVSEAHLKKMESSWMEFLRHLVKGGWARKPTPEGAYEEVHRLRYTNADIVAITKTNFVRGQHMNYIGHICRCPNTMMTKKMLFAKSKKPYYGDPWMNITKMLGVSIEQAKRKTQEKFGFAAFVESRLNNATLWHPEC